MMQRRFDDIAPIAVALLLGAPFLVGGYPPMGDLPLHESIGQLLARHRDPQFSPPGLYALSLGHPQQLLHFLLAGLALVLPSIWTAKIAAVLVTSGSAFAVTRALDHFGKSRWAALACAPLFLGWLLHWGFATNLLALGLFAWSLPALDRAAAEPIARRTLAAAGWLALLFAAHAAIAIAGALCLLVFAAVRRKPAGVVAALVPAVLFAVERMREAHSTGALAGAFASRVLWHDQLGKWRQLPAFLIGRYTGATRFTLTVIALAAVLALVHARYRKKLAPRLGSLVDNRLLLAAGALLVVILAAPYSINYGAFLYARFVAPAWICLVVGLAPSPKRITHAARLLPVACVVASLAALVPELRRADAHQAMLAPLFARIERGSAVAVLHYGPTERTPFGPVTLGQRVLAERGGRLLFSFVEYPSSPLTIPPPSRWDEMLLRVYGKPGSLRPAVDLLSLRYLLVHVEQNDIALLLDRGFPPDARFVQRSGEWTLYESTHDLRPVQDAAAPMPEPVPETIQKRVDGLLGAQ